MGNLAFLIRIGQLLRDFEALGRPPAKLVESYEALERASTSFQTEYDSLEIALDAQSTNPFSARFLGSAHGQVQKTTKPIMPCLQSKPNHAAISDTNIQCGKLSQHHV